MRAPTIFACLLAGLLTACSPEPVGPAGPPPGATAIPMKHAKTFKVYERDGYRIVDLSAPIITWGGGAEGPEQSARLVLVPREAQAPKLEGDLAGATLVRVPATRIATNFAPLEAMLRELGVADRLVAVGGVKSYDDSIREKARSGLIRQIGYGWHSPPELDALLGSRPDLFLMSMGDLSHAQHYRRIKDMGVPVVPVFLDAEPHYMGDVDYVRLIGLLTGREREADAFVAKVGANVERLKAAAASQTTRSVISAWYAGGDRWMATIRNADNALLRDANGKNLLAEGDDNRLDSFSRIGTETLLQRGRDADCWIVRDSHSKAFTERSTLKQFRAWRDGCLYASDGMHKLEADAFDIYETGTIRPDLLLADLVAMLHPPLRTEPARYIRPDTQTPR